MAGFASRHFSERAREMRASEVRELLKLLQVPDMISFAGGLPNPESFPVELVREIACDILDKEGGQALQYGITEGLAPFRETLAEWMSKKGMNVSKDNMLVVSGSQQVIDLMAKVFVNPRDTVVVSAPTYLAGLTGFGAFQATFESIPLDSNNMRVDILEERLAKFAKRGDTPKIVYVLPNFHNPAGVTMPEKGRRRLVELASEYDFIMLEDDPYGELRYVGKDIRPIKSFDDEGRVVYMSTFSKILAPGLRVGWVAADVEVLKKLIISKQSTDVCTNVLGQRIAHEYVVRGHVGPQVERIKELYGRKLKVMLEAMTEFMPEGVTWERPEGGMFLWVSLPPGVDQDDLLKKALRKRVAFVQGKAFFADPKDGSRNMRLNFTFPDDDKIVEGLRRLGSVINQEVVSKWDKTREAEERRLEGAVRGDLLGKS